MPNFTQEQIEGLVDTGKIIGLTLDTTEFFHVGYNYEAPSFKALAQFDGGEIKVIFSEVVLNEVHADLRDDIEKKAENVRTGLRQTNKAARLGLDVEALISNLSLPDASDRSLDLLNVFIDRIGAHRVPVDDGVTARKLHDLYFAAEPPFSKRPEKKNEFPDAMALLSLEHWAEARDGYVLAISGDNDWKAYAAKSQRIICASQLAPALSLFNRSDAVVAGRLSRNMSAGSTLQLNSLMENVLHSIVETFEVEANAPFSYEVDDEYGAIKEWSIENDSFDVIASDEDTVTIAFTVNVVATFTASFTFEVRDSIDRDYVTVGGAQPSKNETFGLQIVVTVDREDDSPDPVILEIEAEGPPIAVDFGYVDIDYGDDPDAGWQVYKIPLN